jgi:hypothetical protein
MYVMKKFLISLFLVTSLPVLACSEDGKGGIVEDNDLYIPHDAKYLGGITEEQFNSVISKIETIYVPIASNMGGKLKIARKWTDGTVNANASRAFGGVWNVNMYGGLARHSTITEDGFALVLCHEIGHHIGGAPKNGGLMAWASNEGQSDYFAALKCLRKTFLNDNNTEIVSSLNAPAALVEGCAKAHGADEDKNICIRTGMAGMSVARLFAALRNQADPSFETPDRNVVATTFNQHPAFQCRLDTYFQGSICEVGFNEDVSQKDEVKGTCHASMGHTNGLRPLCWFKPKAQ